MARLKDSVITSFNDYVREQQEPSINAGGQPEEMRFTLIQFDSSNPFELVHDSTSISKVPPLTNKTFQPRGGTPLYDALAATIHHADENVDARTNDTAEATVVVVFTDGAENSSQEWDRDGVFKLIEE